MAVKKEVKEKNTKVFYEVFNGHNLFVIYEVDDNGEKTSERNIVSFGKAKALELSKHSQELHDPRSDKGKFYGHCNRTACDEEHATWFNHSTEAYYCEGCAHRINQVSEGNSWHPLLTNKAKKDDPHNIVFPSRALTLLRAIAVFGGISLPDQKARSLPKMKLSLEELEELQSLSGKAKKDKLKELKQRYGQ